MWNVDSLERNARSSLQWRIDVPQVPAPTERQNGTKEMEFMWAIQACPVRLTIIAENERFNDLQKTICPYQIVTYVSKKVHWCEVLLLDKMLCNFNNDFSIFNGNTFSHLFVYHYVLFRKVSIHDRWNFHDHIYYVVYRHFIYFLKYNPNIQRVESK